MRKRTVRFGLLVVVLCILGCIAWICGKSGMNQMEAEEPELDYILGRPMTEEEIREQKEITEEAMKHPGYIQP